MLRWSRAPGLRRHDSLVLLGALLCCAASAIPAAGAARAVIPEISYDAGEVRLGAAVTHDFIVRNAGDAPLHITEATPSCGCTVTNFDQTIAPGGEGRIKVRIATGELSPGRSSKTVSVATDAPDAERFVLQVKLALVGALEFLPYNPVYIAAKRGREEEQRILLRVHQQGLEVRGVSSSNPLVEASLVPVKSNDQVAAETDAALKPEAGDYWIVLALRPTAPPGRLSAAVTVRTSDPVARPNVLKIEAVVR